MPCIELALPRGDRLRIALHGAQVLSWVPADGVERLYLSPRARFDGTSAIRGGVPICFPQFNERALGAVPLPKHGFARTQPWTVREVDQTDELATATFELTQNLETLLVWPYQFSAVCTIELEADSLNIEFAVRNNSDLTWPFAIALHTYLRVDDISRTEVHGLKGVPYWDAVQHRSQPELKQTQQDEALRFASETDRVYSRIKAPVLLSHTAGAVRVSQSPNFPEMVVWNPGAVQCAAIADMPPDGFKHMLCIEAARISTPQILLPGDAWRGWQALRALPPVPRSSGFVPITE